MRADRAGEGATAETVPPPWRIAIISSVAPVGAFLVETVRELGHDPVAVITARRPSHPMTPPLAITDASIPAGVDVLLARDKRSLEPLLRAVRPDLVLCNGFPWLIPAEALAVPPLGAVNHHPALLPRHRGPIPASWAIRAGDAHYGVTWHRMDAEFDTGPILAQATVPMELDDADMFVVGPRLLRAAAGLLPEVFRRIAAGDPGDPQEPTGDEPYAGWFEADYADIDWSRPARAIHDQVRAWALVGGGNRGADGPFATLDGRRVRITRTSLVEAGDGATRVEAGDGPIWVTAVEPVEPAEPVEPVEPLEPEAEGQPAS